MLVVQRCHSKSAVTWGNEDLTLVITTRPFVPFSVLSRNIRGTRGTSRDGPQMGLRDSADPHGRVVVGFELQYQGFWPVSLDIAQVPDQRKRESPRSDSDALYPAVMRRL